MPRDDTPAQALRAASWQRVCGDFERLASKPRVSLVALVQDGDGACRCASATNAGISAFLHELAARKNQAHWQGTVFRPVDGQPDEYEPVPASHRLFGFGATEAWDAFRMTAIRAGALAKAVPDVLPEGTPGCVNDLDRWMWVLFEVGWRQLDSIPFRATRWVRSNGGATQLELARAAGRYRGWWYSEIGDAVSASIDVVDVLRTMERAAGTPSDNLDAVAAQRRTSKQSAEHDAQRAVTPSKSPTLAVSPARSPSPHVKTAMEMIRERPGQAGKAIATKLGISPEWFRKGIVPKLKKLGVTNTGQGYHPPPDDVALL